MNKKFIPEVANNKQVTDNSYILVFSNDDLFVTEQSEHSYSIPLKKDITKITLDFSNVIYIGTYQNKDCFVASYETDKKSEFLGEFKSIRSLLTSDNIDSNFMPLFFYAHHIILWDKKSLFCGRCGTKTKHSDNERAKICTGCELIIYPRISPAIIVAVYKDDQILLARGRKFKSEMYSVLAGFLEMGETLEECVKREIKEEVGIDVHKIEYFKSQPWPFPDSLMIGFTAEYKSGDINIDPEEIIEANWYSYDNLPNIPGKVSISGQLIQWFCRRHLKK